jgi:hypothetical protein
LFAELSLIELTARRHTARLGAYPQLLCIGNTSPFRAGIFLRLGQICHGDGRTTSRITATAISSAGKPSPVLEIGHVSDDGGCSARPSDSANSFRAIAFVHTPEAFPAVRPAARSSRWARRGSASPARQDQRLRSTSGNEARRLLIGIDIGSDDDEVLVAIFLQPACRTEARG